MQNNNTQVTNSNDNEQNTNSSNSDVVEISEEGRQLAEQQSAGTLTDSNNVGDGGNTQAQNNAESPESNPPAPTPVQPPITQQTATDDEIRNSEIDFGIYTENFPEKPETETFNLNINGGSNIKVSYTVFKNMTNFQFAQAIKDGLKAASVDDSKIDFNDTPGAKEESEDTCVTIMNKPGNADFYVIDNVDSGYRGPGYCCLNGLSFGNWGRPEAKDIATSLGYYPEDKAAAAAKNVASSVDMSKVFNTTYSIALGDDGTTSFGKSVTSQSFSLKVNGVKDVTVTYDVKQNMSARELMNSINNGIQNAGLDDGFTAQLEGKDIVFGNSRYNTNFYVFNMFNMGTSQFGSVSAPLGLQTPLLIGNIINDNANPFLSSAEKTIKDMFQAGNYGDYHGGF